MSKSRSFLYPRLHAHRIPLLLTSAIAVTIGIVILTTRAAGPLVSLEPENAQLSGGASSGTDANASSSGFLLFGNGSIPPPFDIPPGWWLGDLSNNNWLQYDSRPDNHPDGRPQDFKIVTPASVSLPDPGFAYLFEATTTPQSSTGDSGRRTLTTLFSENTLQHGTLGNETWARDMLYLPSATWHPTNGSWGVDWFWEWHNWPDSTSGNVQIALGVFTDSSDGRPSSSQGKLALEVHGGGSAAHPIENSTQDMTTYYIQGPSPVPRDRWMNMAFHTKWSGGSDGFIEMYLDGKLLGRYNGPTLLYYADNDTDSSGNTPGWGKAYWQHGQYTGPDLSFTSKTYHAGAMVGPTAASIGYTIQ